MLTAVVAIYLLGTLIVGAALSTRVKRASDYLLAGRVLPEEVCVNGFFRNRRQMQMRYLGEIQNRFNLPVLQFSMMQDEIKGVDAISAAGKILT